MIHLKIGNLEATLDTPEELDALVCCLSRVVTDKEMAAIAGRDERADWAARSYSCGLFVDPPGRE